MGPANERNAAGLSSTYEDDTVGRRAAKDEGHMKELFGPLVQRRTYSGLVYLLLALPLGIEYFSALVAGVATGVSTVVVWIGIPILFAMAVLWRAAARFERHLAMTLLGADIAPLPPPIPAADTIWRRTKALFTESFTWRSLAWLLLRFPLGVCSFVLVVVFVSVGAAGVGAPVALLFTDRIELWSDTYLESPGEALAMVAVGAAVLVLAAHVINGLAALHRRGVEILLRQSATERAKKLQQRTTILEERTRLAQELHDAVGHTVTAATLQAGAAGHVFEDDPEFARQALKEIEESGRRALGELDRILGIMREEETNRAPPPGLDSMDSLVANTRRAGVPVRLHTTGRLDSVSPEVGRALYRIAQEALTNVMKHAGSVETEVSVDAMPREVKLTVQNEAPSQSRPASSSELSAGRGLVGVRERVNAYGGTLFARVTESGGFFLEVTLPHGPSV